MLIKSQIWVKIWAKLSKMRVLRSISWCDEMILSIANKICPTIIISPYRSWVVASPTLSMLRNLVDMHHLLKFKLWIDICDLRMSKYILQIFRVLWDSSEASITDRIRRYSMEQEFCMNRLELGWDYTQSVCNVQQTRKQCCSEWKQC